jgi:hypothetical protein
MNQYPERPTTNLLASLPASQIYDATLGSRMYPEAHDAWQKQEKTVVKSN